MLPSRMVKESKRLKTVMSEGWKRFLLQWILPVGIFAVIFSFLCSSAATNIKKEAISGYEEMVESSVQEYAEKISASFSNADSLCSAAAELLGVGEFDSETCIPIMRAVVNHSDTYLLLISDENGTALKHDGDELDLTSLSYYDRLENLSDGEAMYVEDDEIAGNSAVIIHNLIGESGKRMISFYPLNISTIRKYCSAEKDYDNKAIINISDSDGNILISTSSVKRLLVGENIWDQFRLENSEADVRKLKNRVDNYSTGSGTLIVGGSDYLSCGSKIGRSKYSIFVSISQSTLVKNEEKMYSSSISRLAWVIAIVIIFISVITILNVVQLFVLNKDTEDLKDKADTDQLTGLKNKLATEREIKEYIEEHPDSISMMFLIDIDNFKKINDTMGHAFGDEVLRELGKNIGINFRVSDIIGRTGGDEFTIFLKNLKEEQNVLREAQKLVYFFKHFQVGDYVKYSVTASIGVAVFPAHGADFETLYKAADAAVYKSKRRGKAQLSFYDDRDRTPEEIAYADAHQIDIERKEETPVDN